MEAATGHARFGSVLATRPVEVRHDLDGLDSGFWAVVAEFEGQVTAVRFEEVDRSAPAAPPTAWVAAGGGVAHEPGPRGIPRWGGRDP